MESLGKGYSAVRSGAKDGRALRALPKSAGRVSLIHAGLFSQLYDTELVT